MIESKSKMFQPFNIGGIELKNRLVQAPATTNFCSESISEQQVAFHAARARGGVGLVIAPPAHTFMPGGSANVLTPRLAERADMPGWNELAETVHAFGAKIFGQVAAGPTGRQMLPGHKAKGASPLPIQSIPQENIPRGQIQFETRKQISSLWDMYRNCPTPEELTIPEIEWVENAYATTVRLMKECGLDGAELHFGHGYLGDNFLSPRTNKRNDAYGGSLENRAKLFRQVLIKSRAQAGNDFVIGVRLTGFEHVDGGTEIEHSTLIAKMGEDLGLSYIHLTSGCWEAVKWYLPEEDGTMLPEARAMRETVKIPVITPSIHDPSGVEKAIEEGSTDLVSLCRPLIADPEWVNKVFAGKEREIRKCMRCLACLRRTRFGLGMRCEVNREVGEERYNPHYWRSSAPGRRHYYVPS